MVSVSAALLSLGACPKERAAPVPARKLGAVEHIQLSGAIRGDAYVIPLETYRFRVLAAGGRTKRRPVEKIVRAHERVVATNGSFFDVDGSAMGLVVDEGRLRHDARVRPWGALVIDDAGARIVKGGDVDLAARPDLVLQGQPRLVQNGTSPTFKEQTAKRTVVCLRDEDRSADGAYRAVTLVITEPASFRDLAVALKRRGPGALGCRDALNLDGGPSTQLVARIGDVARVTPDGDAVPNALVALPRVRTAHAAADSEPPATGGTPAPGAPPPASAN